MATPLGLLLAVLLDQKIRGSRIYQSIFFAPVMLSLPLIGIIWQLMYTRNEGFINNVLGTANTARGRRLVRGLLRQPLGRPRSPPPGGTPATSWSCTWPG